MKKIYKKYTKNKYKTIYIKKEEKKEKIVILYCYEKNMKKYTKKIYKNIYKKGKIYKKKKKR